MEDDEAICVAPGFLFGCSDGEEEVVAGEGWAAPEFLEAIPVDFEFFAAYGSFFGAAGNAAREDVEFVVLGQELDADVVFDLVPVFGSEFFFEFCETAFRGADEVGDGWVGGAHFLQHGFGRDTPIHDPGAAFLAVLGGDFFQHCAQRGFVGSVAAHDLVGDGQAVRGDDQGDDDLGDDDLEAVGAFVAAVAEGFEVAGLGGVAVGIDLEVTAGKIVEKDVEGGVEEANPAFAQMSEKVFPVI